MTPIMTNASDAVDITWTHSNMNEYIHDGHMNIEQTKIMPYVLVIICTLDGTSENYCGLVNLAGEKKNSVRELSPTA